MGEGVGARGPLQLTVFVLILRALPRLCRCSSGVEQVIRNDKVGGSNPSTGTIRSLTFLTGL